jgi:beta-glucosidase
VIRLFTARIQLGLFEPAPIPYAQIPFSENDSEAHRMLARRVAEESMVLLKNNGVLPLAPSVKTIAVIGPNAAALAAIEGNYNAVPSRPVVPLLGIEQRFGQSAKILYAQGSPYVEGAGVPVPRTVFHPAAGDAREGLKAEYFSGHTITGTPVVTRVDPQINFDWNAAAPAAGVPFNDFGVRWTGTIQVPAEGDYAFGFTLAHCYPCHDAEAVHVWVDDKEVAQESPEAKESRSSDTKPFTVHFANLQPHTLRVEYTHHAPLFGAGITLDWHPKIAAQRDEAVKAANAADVVIAFVGLTPELEGEEMPIHIEGFSGGDRTSIALPREQQQMLEAVAATGKPLVVVLMNGSAIALPWAKEHAAAILEAWYPGEEGGAAIARVLAGDANPAGRLPLTFYASDDQLPAFDDYSMKNRTYRYFDGKPAFGFGYGLSYTRFTYGALKLSTNSLKAGDPLQADVEVHNTGSREGDEVAELYLLPPHMDGAPKLALEAFQRVHLKPGERRTVHFTLTPRQLSLVDGKGTRAVRPGEYKLSAGGAQPGDTQASTAAFTIIGTQELPR